MNPTMQPPQPKSAKKQNVKTVVLLAVVLFIGIAIALGAYLITQQQNTSTRATGAISCPVEGASCEWDAAPVPNGLTAADETSYKASQTYNYTIVDKTTNTTVKSGTTTSTKVTFTPQANHTYQCKVVTASKCGVCDEQTAEGTCSAIITPTATKTPTPTSSPSPTLSPTATPTPNPECGSTCTTDSECPNDHLCRSGKCILDKCADAGTVCTEDKCSVVPPTATNTPTSTPTETPTSTPTATNTPTNTPTETPTGTTVPSATATNTPTTTGTPAPTNTGAPTATPTEVVLAQSNPTNTPDATAVPTIPSAGSSSGVYFMVVAGIVLASLLLVF